ncbi:MAG: cobalamin-binding protein [Acidobacteriia bacterium]|nr:cobalamin-binding protein [Terriglobia bacterium]
MPRILHGSSLLARCAGFALFALLACCSRTLPDSNHRSAGVPTATVEYTDGIGRPIVLPRHPQRVISLAPSVTEVLYLLGADDRLIGVTTHCDWPEDAKGKPKIGTLLNPNFETILAARPDLIIASTAGNDQAAVYKLAGFGLPVFVTAPRSVDGIFETTLAIGRITDRGAQGEQLVARMKGRLQEVKRRLAGLPPTRAFFITWFDPLLAPGRKTFENDVLGLADVVSISAASEEFYPRYSLEQVLAQNPDVILTVYHEGKPIPDLRNIAGWRSLRAVQRGRIYVLSEVLQHPSPRFVDGVEELARKLHPERFQ